MMLKAVSFNHRKLCAVSALTAKFHFVITALFIHYFFFLFLCCILPLCYFYFPFPTPILYSHYDNLIPVAETIYFHP